MGRHIRCIVTASIILLVILLTKKYPQMEILPARNLGEKKITHFIKETALTQENKCAA